MKKILLTLMLFSTFAAVKAQQVVLNEIYGNPGGSNSEFIELYNSTAQGTLDCYTILTYFENEGGTNKGWYVLDLPNTPPISSNPGFFVLAAKATFSVQGTSGVHADVDWNDPTFRGGPSGYLKKYVWNGNTPATYAEANISADSITNLLDGTLNGGQFYFVLLYKNGILINGFIGGGASGDLASYGIPLGSLTVTPAGACGAAFDAFGDLHAVEFFNPSGGTDNGYARQFDGKCGSWFKTSSQANHTPGVTNGSAAGQAGSLTTTEVLQCQVTPGQSAVNFTITAISGAVTLADDFPVEVSVYDDYDATKTKGAGNGILDQYDSLVGTKPLANINITDSVRFGPVVQPIIVVYRTKRGCFDKVVVVPNGCSPLPVKFVSFNAKRTTASSVSLSWQTAFELNNSGFAIERAIGNGSWEQIAFISSQASGGNSDVALNYQYTDLNSNKGISQYRIRQVDLDGKYSFTDIRAVRGIDQPGKTIVYPNPSFDGKVNVVFEDASVIRDVSLVDMSGRVVKQWNGVSNNNLQIENLVPGFYTLRIIARDSGAQSVEKIVINKR